MWTAHQPPSRVTSMSKLGIGPFSEVDLVFTLISTRSATRRFKVTVPGSRNVAKDVFRSRAVDPNGRLGAGEVGGIEQSGRLEVGGDLHDLVVGPAEARSLIGGA